MLKKSDLNEQAFANTRMQIERLRVYLDAARSDSPERLGKLRHLRAAVSSGGYHVDADALSGRIIEGGLGFDGESAN